MLRPFPRQRSPYQTRASDPNAMASTSGTSSNTNESTLANIPTQNAYETLSEGDGNEDDVNEEDAGEISEDEVVETPPVNPVKSPKVRVPPIYVTELPLDDVFMLLKATKVGKTDASLKLSRSNVQILCKSKDVFDAVIATLKTKAVKYFTHNTSDNVPLKFVLSGLPLVKIAKLTSLLAECGVHPLQVKVLSTRKTNTDTHALYLSYFKRGTIKIQDLRQQAGRLNGLVVTWRFFTKHSNDVAQCHRCQSFGHGSSNCFLDPMCVKCGRTHLTSDCTLPKKDNLNDTNNAKSQLKCANCGGSHTANYRGCPKRKSYLESLELRKNQAKSKATGTPPPVLTPFTFPTINGSSPSGRPPPSMAGRGTYADMCKSNGNGGTPPFNNSSGDGLFTMTEFLTIARNMFLRLQGCQTKAQQIWALTELMITYLCG